ncbi:fatty-acid amide hydrolase 2-B [Corythoichthys intestinalis]|uniref:fatty-acid amide hydrolase 2-B n=1 Tax=Corythoichthys intestinalis TaxID=161448 RepID=UPI0025A61E75|nr:fatty-acid amide hydrolase 2-B [Corythoichthys intestinalis]XP_061810814.1 fatty-acid amide hydrolase 2-B-like [Nerophis lumbriciformis]
MAHRSLSVTEQLQKWIYDAFVALGFVLYRFVYARDTENKGKLPPIGNPLLTVSATQLAGRIRRREVSSVEVVQAYIDRIQQVNPLVNAVVKDRFSAALQEAAQVDKLIEEEPGGEEVLADRLPLLGVPLSVKESFGLQGMPNTTGIVSRRGVVATADAPPVGLLKRAGAIPLGVTNTSEGCMWAESHNHLYGITCNPYDLERIPGGSSGGEGSLLGAAGAVIGVGSDIGGSIRMPCFFNGVFGHKTTPGVVSNENQFPPFTGRHEEYASAGPMCRYAEDLLPMLKIMAGPNASMLRLNDEVELKKLRFFTVPDDGGSPLTSPVSEELRQIQRKVVERLQADLGVSVQEVRFPEFRYGFRIWDAYMSLPDKEGKPPVPFAVELGKPGRPVWPLWEALKSMLGKSDHTVAAISLAIMEMKSASGHSSFLIKMKEKLQKDVDDLLGTDGVLFYPSHPRVAPKHHHLLFRPLDFAYTGILNVLGLPVTQCPLGLNKDGLPMGVQVVSGKLQDRLPLAVALYLEKAFGGWREPHAS